MKKIHFIIAIVFSVFSYKADAQVSVSINIGQQPVWGPAGYNYVDYYYLPDYDVYYDVPRSLFVYFDFGRWNFAPSLPPRFGNYDLYHSYKVVINSRNPWLREPYYHSNYARYRGHYQPVIRESRDNRYYAARENYEHNRYDARREDRNEVRRSDADRHFDRGNHGKDNGHGNGGRNNGHGNHDRH